MDQGVAGDLRRVVHPLGQREDQEDGGGGTGEPPDRGVARRGWDRDTHGPACYLTPTAARRRGCDSQRLRLAGCNTDYQPLAPTSFKVTSKGGVAEVWLLGQRLLELPAGARP